MGNVIAKNREYDPNCHSTYRKFVRCFNPPPRMLLAPYRPIIKPKYECQIFHPKEAHQHNPEDALDSDDSSVISHCDSDLSWDYYDIHSEDEIGEWGGHIYGGMEDTPSQVLLDIYDSGIFD